MTKKKLKSQIKLINRVNEHNMNDIATHVENALAALDREIAWQYLRNTDNDPPSHITEVQRRLISIQNIVLYERDTITKVGDFY